LTYSDYLIRQSRIKLKQTFDQVNLICQSRIKLKQTFDRVNLICQSRIKLKQRLDLFIIKYLTLRI